jgi:hypothetical protein
MDHNSNLSPSEVTEFDFLPFVIHLSSAIFEAHASVQKYSFGFLPCQLPLALYTSVMHCEYANACNHIRGNGMLTIQVDHQIGHVAPCNPVHKNIALPLESVLITIS